MRPITVSVGPLAAASVNNIALSQTPGAAGALTLNGSLVPTTGDDAGNAVLDNPRRILITTADTTHTFTIVGESATGTLLTESFLVSTATYSQLDYAEIIAITINGAATAAVTVGTNGIASTPWVRFDDYAPAPVSIQCTASGTVNYTVQQTMDDPNSPTNPVTPSAVTWVATSDTAAVGATASLQTNYAFAPVFARVLLNSGTGTVTATFLQSGAVPY
jgi:hypothetical protein